MSESNGTFLRSNLDKFLLVFLLVLLLFVGWHASHDDKDYNSGYSQLIQQSFTGVLGALLTLLATGSKKGQSPAQTLVEAREDVAGNGGKVIETVSKTVTVKAETPAPAPAPLPKDEPKKEG